MSVSISFAYVTMIIKYNGHNSISGVLASLMPERL